MGEHPARTVQLDNPNSISSDLRFVRVPIATTIRYLCAMQNSLLVHCTCPDAKTALELAEGLVRDRLAACVSMISGVTSVYEWQGKVHSDPEQLLLIKTSGARYPALQAAIQQRHPYELPEIIAVPIDQGLPAYLKWVEECTLADD